VSVRYSEIEVVISGAVERTGRTRLEAGATVATALSAAGGLAYRLHARPDGEIVLRRRTPSSRRVSVYRWRLFEEPQAPWRSFQLEQHDVLVFGWVLRDDPS